MRLALALVGILTQAELPTAAEPIWKQMATFGIVGAICAWLLIERWLTAGKEREARKALAEAIQANTMATSTLAVKIEDMNRAMWNFVMFGKVRMQPPPGSGDTPPKSQKVPGDPGTGRG